MADIAGGNLGENGIVGGGCGIAAGAALAAKRKGKGAVAVCFLGDGATNEGSFHEAANLASVWELPLLFVCEDNGYGMSMPVSKSMNINDIAERAKSYGIPGRTIDGNDAIEVYREATEAREYVKENGPMLLVCKTYRVSGHSKSDKCVYRTKEELEEWKGRDPIACMEKYMLEAGFAQEELGEIELRAAQGIEDAVRFAQQSPDPSVDTIYDDVYA